MIDLKIFQPFKSGRLDAISVYVLYLVHQIIAHIKKGRLAINTRVGIFHMDIFGIKFQ